MSKTAEKFYDDKRKKGLTDKITTNPEPDYSLPFYQEIFDLMDGFAKLKISKSVTNIVNNCDKEPTEPIASDIIKRWDCVMDGMYEDPKGYWIYLEDHERVTTELEKEIESYKSLLDDGVSEVRRLEKENQELREERNILFTLYTNNNKLLTKKL